MRSAFNSAGQRCSAARLFFVQEDVAGPMLDMLAGAVQALEVGDPLDFATDVGPVIDGEARDMLDSHGLDAHRRHHAEDLDSPAVGPGRHRSSRRPSSSSATPAC